MGVLTIMKYREKIRQMTLEEKAALLSGKGEWQTWNIDRLGIPSIVCSDGPHGIRRQAGTGDHLGLNPSLPATCFPTAATVGSSWDPALSEAIGQALGEEAAAQGVNIVLGPGLNLKRSPLCGRNFEYVSEDPYLTGKMAAGYIRGLQSEDVYACAKHFAANNQELRRMSMNAVIDERTFRELYLTGFEIAVKEGGVKAVMSAYNQINGVYANEDKHLLGDILRDEWGFDGIVITDWGGSNDHVAGVAAGSDLEMPNPGLESARQIVTAVRDGRLPESAVDACVDRLLEAVFALSGKEQPEGFDEAAHHALARRAAAESAVLLKNEQGILPLAAGTKAALIGDFAFAPRYQGAGSSLVNSTAVDDMAALIDTDGAELDVVGKARGYDRDGAADEALEREALALAAEAAVVIYCFGLDERSESEGLDRSHMRIPANQIRLLEKLAAVNGNIVGVLSAGSALEMPWHIHLKGLVHGHLYGQAGAGAMLDILTGRTNPSGRLAESYPLRYEDTPAYSYFPSAERNAEYREGLYVGYRYYATAKVPVQYPFGYGLSYTSFAYSDLEADEGGVSFTLANTGGMDGAEVPQLYIGKEAPQAFRPARELKGFRKVFLKAGEKKRLRIPFDDKSFRYWNTQTGRWETEGGVYRVMVGTSCTDIRLEGTVERAATAQNCPYDPARLPSYCSGDIRAVSDGEFEALLGRPVPDGRWGDKLGLNDALCQMYNAKRPLARAACRLLKKRIERIGAQGTPDLDLIFLYNIPFRAIAKMTGGAVSMEMAEGLVMAVNGRFLRGLGRVIAGYFRNRRLNREYVRRYLTGKEKPGICGPGNTEPG